jgi:tRNA (cmo5U34)-methyltransferase
MTDSAAAAFNADAPGYEAPRRRLIPSFDAFYGTAVEALALLGREPARVLDLGAGTGILAARIAAAHPACRLVLVDGAAAMLERAGRRLGDRAELVVADLRAPLPAGPFDAIVSALAIHHLDDADKQDLLRRVRDALVPGGVFVNAEQVAGPGPEWAARYRDHHAAQARARGARREEWDAAVERMRHDRCTDVATQLGWMRAAGLSADCLFKDHAFAVLVGLRPA